MKSNTFKFTLPISILALLIGCISTQAQDSDPLVNVRIVTVKQDHVGDWIELQRERVEALKKSGGRGRSVSQVNKGNHNTFHIVTFFKDWADYSAPSDPPMGEAANANWLNKIQDTIQSRREFMVRGYADLSLPPKAGMEVKYVTVRETITKQGHANAHLAWTREELQPAMVKSGAHGRSISRIVMGGNLNTFYTVRSLESMDDLDEPGFLNALSSEERGKVFTNESRERILETSLILLSIREDLSFSNED
jgi:hypothetical protein